MSDSIPTPVIFTIDRITMLLGAVLIVVRMIYHVIFILCITRIQLFMDQSIHI